MRKISALCCILHFILNANAQNNAVAFEKIILSGNSNQAFELVRNHFGIPSVKDPFLHFKERGIKQLISFYEHRTKRIEATSLIKFSQTREFWKNYSEQFTAGKWSYKSLYKTDSLAWQAANYSITLIYAHEMGHYLSYNLVSDFDDDYTCEEVVANHCLAAFAHSFNGNKKLDMHQQLFVSLIRQTAALIPDSAHTAFFTPMEDWCTPNPMIPFFDHYESDETRFLRLYGYAQFKMMEQALLHYSGSSLKKFMNTSFLENYFTYTGKKYFKPLRYKTISTRNYNRTSNCRVFLNTVRTSQGHYFHTFILNNFRYHFSSRGEIFNSYISDETHFYQDTLQPDFYTRYHLTNEVQKPDTNLQLETLVYVDSFSSRQVPGKSVHADFDIQSAFNHDEGTSYLVKRWSSVSPVDSYELDTAMEQYELCYLFKEDENYYSRRFVLPDSLSGKNNMEYKEIHLAGTNRGIPVLVTNELTKDHIQLISFYPVNTDSARLEQAAWTGKLPDKGYFNIMYPALYFEDTSPVIHFAFWNPVTARIYLIKIMESGIAGYELYNQSFQGHYGPMLKVNALRFLNATTLQVLAETRRTGNFTKPEMQLMEIKW